MALCAEQVFPQEVFGDDQGVGEALILRQITDELEDQWQVFRTGLLDACFAQMASK